MADCDAPPIKKPSISATADNDFIFLLLTDPPYKTLGDFLVLKIFLKSFFINLITSCKSLIFGILLVPIDQTGS